MDIERVKRLRLDSPAGENVPRREPVGVVKLLIIVVFVAGLAFGAGWFLRPIIGPIPGQETIRSLAIPATGNLPGLPHSARQDGLFTAAGYIEPAPPYPVRVTSLISGRLELFEAVEGMPVDKGQTIARLDSAALEREAQELEAVLAVNAARIDHARSIAARTERLAGIGSVSRRELEQTRAELAVLEAERHRLGQQLASVHWQIENTEIKAPVTGVLFERFAQSGQWVGPGHESAIASIYDPARLQVWVDVNQRDAVRVHIGQRVEVRLDAEPGRRIPGRVARILPRASIAKNTVQAKIDLEETTANLRPDMSVRLTFLAATGSAMVTDPNP